MWGTIGKGEIWKNEIRNKAKDGSYYWVDTTIIPLINKDKKPYQYLSKKNEQTIISSIIYSQEQDREYFAEDLHEGLAQTLAGLSFQIHALDATLIESNDDSLKKSISSIKESIYLSLENSKRLAKELMPRSMMEYGLSPSIEAYIQNLRSTSSFSIEFSSSLKNKKLNKGIEITIYRTIVSIMKKAQSSPSTKKAAIELNDDNDFKIRIQIQGKIGLILDEDNIIKDSELMSLQKRVELYGGKMDFNLDAKQGFTNVNIKFESQLFDNKILKH